jgi:hypothetical protein
VLLAHIALSEIQQTAPQQPATSSVSNKFVLDDGTPIKLRVNRNLSSADAKTGDNIDAPAPPAAPKTVSLGQTKDQVVAILGQSQKVASVGAKEIDYYTDMKVIFVDGKVTDVQ